MVHHSAALAKFRKSQNLAFLSPRKQPPVLHSDVKPYSLYKPYKSIYVPYVPPARKVPYYSQRLSGFKRFGLLQPVHVGTLIGGGLSTSVPISKVVHYWGDAYLVIFMCVYIFWNYYYFENIFYFEICNFIKIIKYENL